MPYKIQQINYYLPANILDNDFLQTRIGIDAGFLEEKIGIKERHIAADDESTTDMAWSAASQLLESNPGLSIEIGLLLVCTQSPDYRLPTTACLLQHRLQLGQQTMAFDINLGCSGFIYSLAVAGACINAGIAKKALIVMVDQYSRLIDQKDKNTVSLFGDAASAALVTDAIAGCGVMDQDFGTDGSGAFGLVAYNSGVVRDPGKSSFLYMNAREIFKFTVTVVPESVNRLLKRNRLGTGDIKAFVFHQANKYMLREIQKVMGIRDDQMIIDMEFTGNTVSSTIPIALSNLFKARAFQTGDKIVLCGFGVGLSWGTMLYVF